MKFLYCGAYKEYKDMVAGVIKEIDRYYEQCSWYLAYTTQDVVDMLGVDVIEWYDGQKLTDADFDDFVFANECPPVDEELLLSMSTYESSIVMKIQERYNIWAVNESKYDARARRYHSHLRYWNYMLDAAKVDAVIFCEIPHEIEIVLYFLCRGKNIPTAFIAHSPIVGYYHFLSNYQDYCAKLPDYYRELSEKYKDVSIDDIELPPDFQDVYNIQTNTEADKIPYYMKETKKSVVASVVGFCKKWVSVLKAQIKKGRTIRRFIRSRVAGHILKRTYSGMKRKSIDKKMKRFYNRLTCPADYSEKYVYLPLHYQPELTTSPLAGVFTHQELIAKMVSFYLPEGVWLYIKENPKQTSLCRDKQFYTDLAKLKNVKFMSITEDTYKLIENSLAVAAATGTAGYEAMFMEKPFLMFGSHTNMYAPGTFNIRNNKDLKEALDYIMTYGPKHTLKDMKIYLKAISETVSYAGVLFDKEKPVKDERSIKNLVTGLIRVLDKQLKAKGIIHKPSIS